MKLTPWLHLGARMSPPRAVKFFKHFCFEGMGSHVFEEEGSQESHRIHFQKTCAHTKYALMLPRVFMQLEGFAHHTSQESLFCVPPKPQQRALCTINAE